MNFLRNLVASLLLMPWLALAGGTQEEGPVFPEPQSDTVSDFAAVLNATEEGRISRILADTREKTGVQLVVVTTAGLDALGGKGMRLEDFGRALFDAWGIGDKDRNDGILILIDTGSREARITLGSGYDAVYDERAARVLSSALLPKLRTDGMAAGIEAGILSTRDRLIAPLLAGEPVTATEGFPEESDNLSWRIATGVAAVLGFLGISLWRRARARKACPNCRAMALQRTHEIIAAPTKYQDGIGLEHLTCSACGFVGRKSYTLKYTEEDAQKIREERLGSAPSAAPDPVRSDRKEGFGGGKSGGGGAGGKW